MTQPKLPPISLRLAPDLQARVDTFASEAGLARNGAISELLRRGLAASGSGLPTPEVQAQIKAAVIERQARPVVAESQKIASRPAHKSRLKGEWSPPGKR